MERFPELEKLTREIIDAMQRRDLAATEQAFSRADGSVVIGSDASEYTRDIDEMLRLMQESMPDQGQHMTTTLDDVRAYREGSVGWLDATGRFEREGQSVEMRLTGVAHPEDGQWRFVQMHLSIGVPNEHIFEPISQGAAAAT